MPSIIGTAGDDNLIATGGGDTIDGGAGNDKLTLDRSTLTSPVNLNFTAGLSTPITLSDGTSLVNVEHLFLTSGSALDIVTFTQPTCDPIWGGNFWDGGAGSDSVSVNLSADVLPITAAPSGVSAYSISDSRGVIVDLRHVENITIIGGSGDDKLTGDTGNDLIVGNGGNDVLDGGAGNDTASFALDTAGVTVNLITGVATGTAVGTDTLSNFENIAGGSGDDTLIGNDGVNRINASGGNNTISAGDGNDSISDAGAGSTIDGGSGNDLLSLNRSTLTSNFNLTFTPGQSAATTLPDGTTFKNIEYLTLATGSGDDNLTFVEPISFAMPGYNTWNAGTGNDTATVDLSSSLNGISANWYDGSNYWIGFSGFVFVSLSGVENLSIKSGHGSDTLRGGTGIDTLDGGAGNDTLDGDANVDTAVVAGNRAAYTVTQTSTGHFTVNGPDGTDTLTNIEYVKFDDQTIRLLPGAGTSVTWSDPSSYMAAIRDFDGNDLGGAASWKLIGTADVNGDGRAEHILFNQQIGRWAEVGSEADGLTYFANYNWAGDTRVVGIYLDPLVANGTVVKNSDFDSQRRFQNDLMIDNIHGILGQGDYNHDGLQEVYFSLTDGTAYLHAYMHADGNIQYANYQNKQQVIDYLTTNGVAPSTWSSWFPASQSAMAVVTSDALTTVATSSWALATGTGS